ncbi:MAG: hypothetical protein JSU81_03865 [Candidatus Coatesbacteria bacterium]|nr:MAG: hypothetical protein JSU81_03865 [Candidatus Coatesbacteria bacterium]
MKQTVGFAITAALALLACGGPEGVSPGPDLYMPAPTRPKIVLHNVEEAFDARHIKILKANLSNDFTFYFKAEDVGARVNGYVIPVSWTEAEMRRAAGHLFDRASRCSMGIDYREIPDPGSGANTFRANEVYLTFFVFVDEYSGYEVDYGYCNFEFESYAGEEGERWWRLTAWEDFTTTEPPPGGDQLKDNTLGRILARYYN